MLGRQRCNVKPAMSVRCCNTCHLLATSTRLTGEGGIEHIKRFQSFHFTQIKLWRVVVNNLSERKKYLFVKIESRQLSLFVNKAISLIKLNHNYADNNVSDLSVSTNSWFNVDPDLQHLEVCNDDDPLVSDGSYIPPLNNSNTDMSHTWTVSISLSYRFLIIN